MQRIYLSDIPLSQELCISQQDIYHQITRVMRAKVGQKYIFFDGIHCKDSVYKIASIDSHRVIFVLEKILEKNTDTHRELHLFQALPHKLEKIEYILMK